MFKSISIKAKLLMIVISSIIVVSVAMIVQSIVSLQETSDSVIEKFKADAYQSKQEELENYVSLAMKSVEAYHARTSKEKVKAEVQSYLKEQTGFMLSIMEGTYEKYKGTVSDDELKELIRNTVKSTRYGKTGYFWINDTAAKIVMHPIKPQLDGKDLANYKDKGGKKIFSEFARVASSTGEGFVDYVWPKPGFEAPQDKVSFVKLFKPFNWVVGTGEYVDNVSDKLKKEALANVKSMRYGAKGNGYFWVNDSNHVVIMHSIKSSIDGKSMYDLQDPNGKYLYREIVKAANQNAKGGVVDYMWSKPGSETPQPKISYVKKFEPWDWIIGTGVYVDDIETKIAEMEQETEDKILEVIIRNCVILFVIMIILGVVMAMISNRAIFRPLSEFQDGLLNFFKYINKEKSTVDHLDDSANDEIGNMAKIINENVVKTKSLIEQDAALISDVTRVVEQVKEGYLNNRVEKTTENESLQRLQTQLNEMLNNLETNIGKDTNVILDILSKYGQLDFRDNISNASGQVENAINDLSKIINQMLAENKENGLTLDASSDILLENVDTLNTNSTTTAAALEETAAALEEITSTIINNTETITTMATHSDELSSSIKVGQDLASSTVKAMDEINDQTEAIADAITVIDQIAFQTNILSLNAAVEAATAGEAGKGFAVVAQEVRNLAARSAEAAKEIKDLVENATAKTNAGKDGADKMIKGYDSLNESIQKTTELINTISEASKEQRTGIEQINDAVTQLDQQTQQNVVISNTTQSIAAQTDEIAKLVVSSANEKEFIGKDEIKSKEVKTSTKSANEILADIKSSTNIPKKTSNVRASRPSTTYKAPSTPKQSVSNTVVSNTSGDDEWESF
ncbi:methyl-accepting chemotaxis protein [Poseidonibacter lekithochrous]|uniref:methyl-accepting chemotaxis protein n=1 Tax=Poseidonibacter lekithochrous TaxID=1904463 RepID=UPI0008FC7F2B|nr:cache domain-containing protein [Poseidonibacter lekithochrous]QKJ22405.1 Cache sensor-containing MCP-domain signal transduction protein [Poseidonibacter lekithochrous]